MEKTKKSGFLKIAGIMAAVMMLATCVVAGTMAKYTSTGSVSGLPSATPAKWSIKVGETDIATESTVSLSDLEWEILPINTENGELAVEEGKIAPGTWGYAAIKVTNESEVDANVTASITNPSLTQAGGLSFKTVMVKGDSAPSSYESATGELSTAIKLAKKSSSSSESLTIYVCYQWLYEAAGSATDNDADDTARGAAAAEISFSGANLTITATQVVPKKTA